MISYKAIIDKKAQRLWEKYHLQQLYIDGISFSPMEISLPNISPNQLSNDFAELREAISNLQNCGRDKSGYGYEIYYKVVNHRLLGLQKVPKKVVFSTSDDFVKYIKKENEYQLFCETLDKILNIYPNLRIFIKKQIQSVMQYQLVWPSLLAVCDYFLSHPKPNIYLRMLSIPGVDTKFIEAYQGIITKLLDYLLPESAINKAGTSFIERYFLKQEEPCIRFRCLDKHLFISNFSDITVPLSQFIQTPIPCNTIFITENKTNWLCLPDFPGAIAIFGSGFAVNLLAEVKWLADKQIYYWGDIDTYGFSILSQFRSIFPNVQALMMNHETLFQFQKFWVKEKCCCVADLKYLTQEEQELYQALLHNHFGENIRLEQERIDFHTVMQKLGKL